VQRVCERCIFILMNLVALDPRGVVRADVTRSDNAPSWMCKWSRSVFGVKAEVPPSPLIDLCQCRAVLKWTLRARDSSLERARLALSTKMATSLARSRVQRVGPSRVVVPFASRRALKSPLERRPAIQTSRAARAGFHLQRSA